LKASSIYYALFLCVIIGLFLGGMILFAGINKQFETQIDIQERLMNNARSGVEYGLANHQELNGETQEIVLSENPLDSVTVQNQKWGAFDLVAANAHNGKYSFKKITLTGHLKDMDEPSLFLCD